MTEKINLEELKPMMEAAVLSMAGVNVRVNFRAPLIEGYQGQVFKDGDGMLAMDLLPVEDIEELYKVFLHEVAHCLFHTEDAEPRPAEIVTAHEKGIQFLASGDAEYWNSPQELEARGFADYFYDFTKQKARFFYGENHVKACLRVCANTTIQEFKKENNNV